MNRNDILVRADEILRERVSLDETDARAIEYLKECVERFKELDRATIFKAPAITIKDLESDEEREFGADIHDMLRIQRIVESETEDGKTFVAKANLIAYENLQNGDGSFGGYEIQANEEGYIPNRMVIEVNEKLFPEQKPCCAICGSEDGLHNIVSSADWNPIWYCQKCKKNLTKGDIVANPRTKSDYAKNMLIIMNCCEEAKGLDDEL